MSLLPWDNLQVYVHDWMKGLQEIVDSIAPDPGEDNSMLPLASLPYKFDCTAYCTPESSDLLDGYSTWDKGYGHQPWLVGYRINLTNNNLRVLSQQYLGKNVMSSPDRWGYLTNEDIAALEEACRTMYNGETIEFENNYPANEIKLWSNNTGGIGFYPVNHQEQDIKFVFPAWDRTYKTSDSYVNCTTTAIPTFNENTGYWEPSYYYDYQAIGAHPAYSVYSKIIAVFDSETLAENVVNAISPHNTNNDVINYTKSGHEYKLYYGDNYLIYALDSANIYDYTDLFTGTNQATTAISGWHPTDPPIKTPTYNEVKHEDDPQPITDDNYIDMGLGVETDGMAMYNMAVLSRDDLVQLITDFETNADTGLSFLPHVLGLYKLGIESSQLLTTNSDTINLHKEPGKTAFISADNYAIVDKQLQVIDCGSITVDREELLTNTFLDYSPYSTYEMFIPGCGWITLPDTVVGRTISVHIVFDLTTCSCKGVVRSEGELLGGSGSTIATVNGIIGSSVPLSINETGLQRGAIMSGAVQTVTALGTTAMGIGIGNPYIGMSGIAMAAGSLAESHIAGNATYTSTKGGATDYSVFGDGYKAVLKITRPKLEIPDNYGHTVGYVVNMYDTLGNYSGFTVCLNPHITGLTCTSEEKDEIARLLERGVILPSGE